MRKPHAYFVSGLVLLAPAFLTVLFIGYLVKLADHFVVNPVFQTLPIVVDANSKVLLAKVIIAVFVLLFVTALGFAAEKFIFRKVLESGEAVLMNIPVFSKVYLSFKEISQAFFGEKSGIFKRVVFIEYPRKGLYALGFVTQEKSWELSEKVGKDLVSVFLPHPPNPAAGYFVFVPREELIETHVTVEEAIRLTISAGAAFPNSKKLPQ
jgi:uncharacterized membrane protein